MRQLLSASVCGLSLLFLTVVSAGATTRTVCASGCAYTDLQSAIDAAVFGDTILLRAGQTFVDITLDRSYVDGDRYKGQKRGITLSGKRLGVLNRYSSDIKAVDVDSQAIIGYNGPASASTADTRVGTFAFLLNGSRRLRSGERKRDHDRAVAARTRARVVIVATGNEMAGGARA